MTAGWEYLRLYCGYDDTPLEVNESGPWGAFYACPNYPDCYNRMTIDLYEKILDYVTNLVAEDPEMDWTGHRWKYRTPQQYFEFEIKRQTKTNVYVWVKNMKKGRRRDTNKE